MKKALVFGGCGHVGSFLAPRLVDMGYEVHVVSRGNRGPYTYEDMPQWEKVHFHVLDRRNAEDRYAAGNLALEIRPDVICDLISYNREEIEGLMEPILKDEELCKNLHVVQVGTVWVYEMKFYVPVTEDHPRTTDDSYGVGKAAVEEYLHGLSKAGKIKSTVIFPGHISGKYWTPINPQGNVSDDVYRNIIEGKPVVLPDEGHHTLHHVHSSDIAGLIAACLENPEKSNGETFHATTEKAVTLSGLTWMLYKHFGHEPKIEYTPMANLAGVLSAEDYRDTTRHLRFCSQCSMEKAKRVLGFVPKYNTMDIIVEYIEYQQKLGNL